MNEMPAILYVDDEEHNLTSFRATFRRNYTVHTALSATEGRAILEEHPIEVIITDQRMPGMTGVEFLESVIPDFPYPVRMVLTGYSDVSSVIAAINSGQAYRYITKPWDEAELKMTIDGALEFYRLQKENRELMAHLAAYNVVLEQKVEERTRQLQEKTDLLEESNKNIRGLNTNLVELNYEKTEFLAIAARDLKKPLDHIAKTAHETAERYGKLNPEKVLDNISSIRHDAYAMQETLNKLLQMNEIETGKLKLFPVPFDPGMLVQSVVMDYQPRAAFKNMKLNFERAGNVSMAHTDPTLVSQIVENLVSNAVRFSKDKSSAHVRIVQNGDLLRCEVQDEGLGISDEDMPRLFKKFSRLSTHADGGQTAGLGLAIVKNLVDALQGAVWCESVPGAGATFIVELPKIKH